MNCNLPKLEISEFCMTFGLAKAGRMAEACKFFEGMPVKDVRAWNVMLEGYVGFECAEKAGILFQEMPEKDLDSWIAYE
ncbi:Pentatricopeptide repeat - like 10 [Theobroma cacao]|nr:Pentatricopeptide repeat - like 10 [Theobroma cacao]